MSWRSWVNAEIYDRFVRERTIYAWLNRTLVRLSEVSRAERILDLACGTGATTLASLGEMGPRAEILGVDASPAMIQIARSNVRDPRARFIVATAGDVNRLEGSFDRVLCNAAFWQFWSSGEVLAAVQECTRAGARVVFNVPAERVEGQSAPIHPFQVTLMQEVKRELGEPPSSPLARFACPESLPERYGFSLVGADRVVYEGTQDELIELMTIPAMIQPLTPGVPDARREAILARAQARSDPDRRVNVPWIFFTLERNVRSIAHRLQET